MTKLKIVLKKEFLKKHLLEIGVILCFVLPPVGILWLMLIGWNQLKNAVDLKAAFYLNATTFFFVCLAIATLGATFTEDKEAYMLIFAMILGYLGLYLYIKERVTMSLIRRFKWIMIIGGVYLVIFGSVMRHFQVTDMLIGGITGTLYIGPLPDSVADGRLFGTAYNPNFASFLLLLILSFLLADQLKRQHHKQMIWNYVLITIMMFGIFQTGSRSGIGVMFLVLIIFMLRLSARIGMAAAAIPFIFHKQIADILPRFKLFNEAFLERKEIWETSLKIWEKYPFFGTTPLGYRRAYDQFTQPEPHAHNIILGFFTEYGTIGGLAFIFLVMTFMLKLCCLFFINAKNKTLLNFFLLSLPVIFFSGIFDHPLVSPQTALLAIIILACFDRYTGNVPLLQKAVLYVNYKVAKVIY
ncbi:O-antigen ligase family protein [Metabacillus schmidteae]|uniref:O-antigen ligase family protein n=1 Tax=Metabacillus schmidteae TaxID=2730405 RepID=UPI00158CCD01|nr:O-antigen ligase family protein [Metabacillus schmidteae]